MAIVKKHSLFLSSFLGETSSGKTSIINLIIGKDILPVAIEANTNRLCRIKNSTRRSISTFNAMDDELNAWTFQSNDQMTQKLNELAEISNSEIKYVNIYLPVQMLKVSFYCFFHLLKHNQIKMHKHFEVLKFCFQSLLTRHIHSFIKVN